VPKRIFREAAGIGDECGIESRASPGLAQPLIQSRQCRWENFPQIVDHTPALGRDIGFFQQDFTGAPETLQNDFELLAQSLLLTCREILALAGYEQAVE
jgi:hypothetical protein